MPTVTVYVGLPGSGKSYHASQFAVEQGVPHIEDAFHPDKDNPIQSIASQLANGDCVIDAVKMIHPSERPNFVQEIGAIVPNVVVVWRYLKNEPIVSIKNIIHDFEVCGRSNWMERIETVLKTTTHYKGFDESEAIPVHKAYE